MELKEAVETRRTMFNPTKVASLLGVVVASVVIALLLGTVDGGLEAAFSKLATFAGALDLGFGTAVDFFSVL